MPSIGGGAPQYQVEADQLEIQNKKGKAIFSGNVKIWNDTAEMRANRVEVFYVRGGDTIDYLEGYGNVQFDRGNMYGEGNYAYFDAQSDTIILREDAYVRRGKNEFWADQIDVNIRTENVRMRKNVRGTLVQEFKKEPEENGGN
ncbi:MAG: LptA/OstA family protein [bacterium]